jgi:hypothetical protein
MKHPSIRELFAYWNNLRGQRPAPERGDIEPVAIRNLLADVFILSIEPRAGHPFRLAGTRVCALFGREMKGESFLALFAADARDDMRNLINNIARESMGVVASVSQCDGALPPLEVILLPLAYDGRTDMRLLGALAQFEFPHWLGRRALGALELCTHRYLGDSVALRLPVEAGRRTRNGLVVYEGGRCRA